MKVINKYLEQAKSLLAKMTVEEKVAQLIQIPYAQYGREKSIEWAKKGVGSFLHLTAEQAKEVQEIALQSRLGIPLLFGIDAVRGHALNDKATIFPTQLALACTWDADLVKQVGRATAKEVAADGIHWTFSPLLCLARDPRWGRCNETFGEDPFLTGELAKAMIEGYQGEDLAEENSILACAKHYLAYGEAVGGRDATDSEVTYRKVREVFLPPFQKAVEAGVASIMTAYGSLDGTPLTIDKVALRDILKTELGFEGFVVTDWANVTSLVEKQHVAKDAKEASKLALEAGNDMIMTSPEFYDAILTLLQEGALDEKYIDEACHRILSIKLAMNLWEKAHKEISTDRIGRSGHQTLALEAARRSITLLKNDGILPLQDKYKKIVLLGANADDIQAQYGDWTYFSHPMPNPDRPAIRPYTTLKEGFEKLALERDVEFKYLRACGPIFSTKDDMEGALNLAKQADIIVYTVGDEISQIGEGKDRANVSLSGRQEELFEKLLMLEKPIICVLLASKPLAIESIAQKSNALLCAFNGGAHAGQAIAEAIFGYFNPCGRLPMSFPRHSGQIPVYYNQLPGWHSWNPAYPEGKYADLEPSPLFAFGEGLSYSKVRYKDFHFDARTLEISLTLQNLGKYDGIETVQVYIRDMVSSVLTPIKQLVAFRQTELLAGESKSIQIVLDREAFTLINRKEERVLEPGEFTVYVGASSKDEDLLSETFYLA